MRALIIFPERPAGSVNCTAGSNCPIAALILGESKSAVLVSTNRFGIFLSRFTIPDKCHMGPALSTTSRP
jgi:hypothetical protein